MEPKKPFIIHGEEPQKRDEFDMDPVAREAMECEQLKREALSGPLGQGPFGLEFGRIGPRSEAAYEEQMERDEKLRAACGGLPDSSPEDPPRYRDGEGKPFDL